MMASQALPSCVAFQSKENGKYLRYVHESGEAHKLLHMSGEDAINPFTRFYLEPSRKHDGLVHIRCCYNNKYWTARNVDGKWWVLGDANKPDEDPSNPACTLFKPILIHDSHNSIISCRLLHRRQVNVGEEEALMVGAVDGALEGCMQLLLVGGDQELGVAQPAVIADGELTVTSLCTRPALPTDVSFLGDNDRYLRAVEIREEIPECFQRDRNPYLQFDRQDVGEADIRHVIETTNEGRRWFRVRSLGFNNSNRYWRAFRGSYPPANWMWADASAGEAHDLEAIPIQIQGDKDVGGVFALRDLRSNLFCKRFTPRGEARRVSCLSADVGTITREARIRVRETVFSRRILDVVYDLRNATVFGEESELALDTADTSNATGSPHTITLQLLSATLEQHRWDSTASFKLGVATSISAGIPALAQIGIRLDAHFSGSYAWGSTVIRSQERLHSYSATVPPSTRITVTRLASQGMCTVPFSYSQLDTLTTGETRLTRRTDGMYHGINRFNFRVITQQHPLAPTTHPMTTS